MTSVEHRDWPLRAALLAAAGAAITLALHFLLQGVKPNQVTTDTGRLALAAFLAVGGVAFAFVVERTGQVLSLAFAVVAALTVAGVVYWSGWATGWDDGETWRLTCALLTVAIAAPLFQAWRGARGQGGGIPYVAAHNAAWTDVVLWFASWLFVGIVWGLAFLLSQLFDLIGLHFLKQLLDKDLFAKMLTGLAFGGAIGLLRDRERVLGTLQRVVTTVLSVLAPVLAAGLLLFLLALPFTGLAPLWGATKSTTPILLSCVIGALLLANSVIGDAPEDETRRRALRWAAIGLGIAMLPLGVIAAVSTGSRIGQYGLTPDRLWAVVFCGVACAYGLAYWVALVRARADWAVPVRAANLRLAIGLCGLAFVLSTPLLGYGAISTRDQLARLADGRTSPAKFDWAALRFDFGPSGKAAVERLAKSGGTAGVRDAAATALKSEDRRAARRNLEQRQTADALDQRLRILPATVPLPADLRARLTEYDACSSDGNCTIVYTPGATEAFVARSSPPPRCREARTCVDLGQQGEPLTRAWDAEQVTAVRLTRTAKGWADNQTDSQLAPAAQKAQVIAEAARFSRQAAAIRSGSVDVRNVERRQIFVGGEPVGAPFE